MWEASATLAVGVGDLRRTLAEPLRWRLAFDGGPHLVLSHAWLRGPLKLAPGWRGVHVSAQSLQLPASVLTTLHALFNTLDPGGVLLLDWPAFVLGGRTVASDHNTPLLRAQWRDASSSLARVRPMGDYVMELNRRADDELVLSLATLRGPLVMEGAGLLERSGGARFDGEAWVDESAGGDTRAALESLLNAMGPSSGPKGRTIMNIR
jgi:general secretion pathway protein N